MTNETGLPQAELRQTGFFFGKGKIR